MNLIESQRSFTMVKGHFAGQRSFSRSSGEMAISTSYLVIWRLLFEKKNFETIYSKMPKLHGCSW